MRLVIVFLLLCSLCQSLNVQTTNCTNNQGRETLAMQLANSLVSPDSGIVITGAEISGDCRQFGIFNNGSSVTAHLMDSGATKIPFIENGVTISTGFATYASRSENDYKGSDPSTPDSVVNLVCDSGTNTNENTPLLFSQYCNRSDYDCDFLCDSARLTFNFTLNQTSDLSVSYVFASEEYNYYAGYIRTELFGNTKYAHFNDMFAFFLDGENLALTDDGSVVSVQTINRGNPCTFDKVNDTYYSKPFGAKNVDQFVDNDIWFDPFDYTTECRAQWCPAESSTRATPGSYKTEYNGFTVTLRARKANVLKDVVHTMTFSIADDSDSIVNSQVFLQSGTFGTTRYGCTDPEALNFDSDALEDDESCAYISSATAFVSVPDRVYSKCPADVSFTSTKALKVDVKLCSENDNTCTSSLSSRNVSLGSYTDLTIPSVDSGTISSQVQGVFRLSSQDHASTSSSVVAIDSYDSNAISIITPIPDVIVYACGTYEIKWDSPTLGPASLSAYNVMISDASNGQLVSTIATNVMTGKATWSVSPSTYLDTKVYTIEVKSSTLSSDCIPTSNPVNVTVSHDTPTTLSLNVPSSSVAKMCRSTEVEISIDTDTDVVIEANNGTIELNRISAGPNGDNKTSFFIDPNNFVAGNTYDITARVQDTQLAKCVADAHASLEIVETRVESLILDRSGYWSSICGQEKPYIVSWNISESVLLDIDLCRVNDDVCRNIVQGSCTNSFVATYDNFWNVHEDFLQSSDTFHVKVGLSSKEDQCVIPAMATLNVTSSRDDLVCPLESGSESSGLTSAELTGLVIPIVAVALLIILGTYCYYKRKIRRTKQKAKDMMEAQEVRHDQETRMEQLELPSTHSQLVFDLPVSDSLGDNDAENERLRKQNEALAKELKKHKQVEERLRYRQSGAVDDGDLPGRKVETDEVLFDEMETI